MRFLQRIAMTALSVALIDGGIATARQSGLSESDPMGTIGAGTKIVVGEVAVIIPANEDVVYFQNGVLVSWNNLDRDSPSCRLHVQSKPVVRSLNSGRTFIATSAGFGNGDKSYVNTLYFKNDATVDQLQCSIGKNGSGNLTIGQLRIQLGQLFSLVEAAPVNGLGAAIR
jgi:hypothetical protein